MKLSLEDLQAAQDASLKALTVPAPEGGLGRAVVAGLREALQRAVPVTPVDTGSWRASHRVQRDGLSGSLFIDPSARNVRSGTPVRRYAGILAVTKGGRYDVYQTVYADADAIADVMVKAATEDLS